MCIWPTTKNVSLSVRISVSIVALGVLMSASGAHAAVDQNATAPSELARKRQWTAERFDKDGPPVQGFARPIVAGLEILANHDAVQKNARLGKPLKIGDVQYTRGLYCHAPSHLVVHLPSPASKFLAAVGVDSNDQRLHRVLIISNTPDTLTFAAGAWTPSAPYVIVAPGARAWPGRTPANDLLDYAGRRDKWYSHHPDDVLGGTDIAAASIPIQEYNPVSNACETVTRPIFDVSDTRPSAPATCATRWPTSVAPASCCATSRSWISGPV